MLCDVIKNNLAHSLRNDISKSAPTIGKNELSVRSITLPKNSIVRLFFFFHLTTNDRNTVHQFI